MVYKGIISSVDRTRKTAEVIIPEMDNMVTPMLAAAREIAVDDLAVGNKCVVALFSENLADGAIIAIL
jgi:hypothetical protein